MGESWWSGVESFIRIFISSVTKGNENAWSLQDFILPFWCDSRRLGGSLRPRFPFVIPVLERFPSELQL